MIAFAVVAGLQRVPSLRLQLELKIATRSCRDNAQPSEGLNLDLGAELHHLPRRHAEERGGAFGVALQEGEHVSRHTHMPGMSSLGMMVSRPM